MKKEPVRKKHYASIADKLSNKNPIFETPDCFGFWSDEMACHICAAASLCKKTKVAPTKKKRKVKAWGDDI